MVDTQKAKGGIITAPHHLAAEAGAAVLRDGGNAIEAMVAAAATIAVVYPHMNSVGGDGFWLIAKPGGRPIGIDAAGPSAQKATMDYYKNAGLDGIPSRGPMAALTVAGTIDGWAKALDISADLGGKELPLDRLLADAIGYAETGMIVTKGQEDLTAEKLDGLKDIPGFADAFLVNGAAPKAGTTLRQPALAGMFKYLAKAGLDDFYRGDIARENATALQALGSPLCLADLENYQAKVVEPLSIQLKTGRVFNMPPPTQGVSSLMILALFDRLICEKAESFAHIHGLVEATKQAFILRNKFLTDRAFMTVDAESWLSDDLLDDLARRIDPDHAMDWPVPDRPGDTIWMGAIDRDGLAVSFIQSIFWEYGSGVIIPKTGVHWQNRGHGFTFDERHPNRLEPGKRPFHTLNPAMAFLNDGRVLSYGTMGGEGQPQTQSAVYSRYAIFGQALQQAVSAPRWLLGRTWGENSTSLKLESRFDPALVLALKKAGHQIDMLEPFTATMGHAGAVCRDTDGFLDGAFDPRSDGAVVGF